MKKIISLLSTFAIMSSLAVSVSAASPTVPTLSLEVSTTGYKAGDVVTVVCNYSGFDVTPYDDNEGAGQKVTGVQARFDIPGGLGTATQGEMFLRPGVTNVSGFSTGAPVWNWDINNNQFTSVISNIEDPMQSSGTAFTVSMKLNKDITEDLVFAFTTAYEQNVVYDNYTDWTLGDTVQNKITGANLVSYTLKAPASSGPAGTEIATGVYYVGAKELTGLTDATKFVIKYGEQSKDIQQTLGQILGGEGVGSLTGNLHFAIKPGSVDASTLDFTKFAIETK